MLNTGIIINDIYLLLIQKPISVTLDWTSAQLMRCRKQINVYSDDGNSGSKKCKRVYGGVYGVTWQSVRLIGVWIQAVGLC
jgi:hypothetical protein